MKIVAVCREADGVSSVVVKMKNKAVVEVVENSYTCVGGAV